MAADFKKVPRINLNPSSADRWTTCTASPKFIFDNWDKLPEQDRKFADEGNSAHEVAAALLQGRPVNPKNCPVPVTPEMHWHAWQYMEFVEGLREEGGKVLVEQKLPLFYAEGRNAIVDAAVINPSGLHIVDYKYGEGIIVDPTNNLQCAIYAKTVVSSSGYFSKTFSLSDDHPISITIYQPRSRSEEPFHTWHTTWGVIANKSAELHIIAEQIFLNFFSFGPEMQFTPSEKACQWCPAKGFCKARQTELTKELGMLTVIDDSPKPDGKVLTMTQLAAIVEHGDHIKKWIDDAQEYALQFMRGGGKISGFKLVLSRGGHRYFTDPKMAGKLLIASTVLRHDEIFTEKVATPAQIEKLIGKGNFPTRVFDLIAKPPGQPVIAKEDDKRDSYLVDAAAEFIDLDQLSDF